MIDETVVPFSREAALMEPLLGWLRAKRRIREDSYVVPELPWFGRYVDLVTLNRSATTLSFELKLRDNARALEQAALNTLSFDMSYVVTATEPRASILKRASEVGVGVILVTPYRVEVKQEATRATRDPLLRARLLKAIKGRETCSLRSRIS